MRNYLFVLVLFLLTSCVSMSHITETSGLNEDFLKEIPKEAKVVIIQKNISADKLYDEVYTILLSRNHRIAKDNNETHYITTEGKDVGLDTFQRMNIFITESGGMSIMKITAEWKPTVKTTDIVSAMAGRSNKSWIVAKWSTDRHGIAFAESVAIAKEIRDGYISYE